MRKFRYFLRAALLEALAIGAIFWIAAQTANQHIATPPAQQSAQVEELPVPPQTTTPGAEFRGDERGSDFVATTLQTSATRLSTLLASHLDRVLGEPF